MIIDDNRRRHVTILMSERGSWTTEASSSLGLEAGGKSSSSSLTAKTLGSYQNRLLKRSIKRSKSVINMFISTSDSKDWENTKAKNITQVLGWHYSTFFKCTYHCTYPGTHILLESGLTYMFSLSICELFSVLLEGKPKKTKLKMLSVFDRAQ